MSISQQEMIERSQQQAREQRELVIKYLETLPENQNKTKGEIEQLISTMSGKAYKKMALDVQKNQKKINNISTGINQDEQITNEQDFESFRQNQLKDLNSSERYPNRFKNLYPIIESITDFKNKFDYLKNEEVELNMTDGRHSISGRLNKIRSYGNKLYFFDLWLNNHQIQIVSNKMYWKQPSDFTNTMSCFRNGDWIGVNGFVGRTRTGELSLFLESVELLCPTMIQMSEKSEKVSDVEFGFQDQEKIYRQPELAMIASPDIFRRFYQRSIIIRKIRNYFDTMGFLEVETPVLNHMATGATAKPFKTTHNDLGQEMTLRIATEIPLKRLRVGGFNKVYELGRVFRNEGIDNTHNPEFTSIEAYMDGDYLDMMRFTQQLIHELTRDSPIITYQGQTINFNNKFDVIQIIPRLKECIPDFPETNTFETSEGIEKLKEICMRELDNLPNPQTPSKMIDKLIGHFIEDKIVNPTFIVGHPRIMCPLAKTDHNDRHLTQRFELFIMGKEIANGYSELNDPSEQLERFQEQLKNSQGDEEIAGEIDYDYIESLKIGLPPTTGLGIGIDRLVMFLTDAKSIKQVICFPTLGKK